MDLFFEPTRGKPFAIEVGYFDTVLEIKEKIQKYQSIPVSKQTLMFNGQVLEDELNVHLSDILDSSHIQLIIAAAVDPEKPNIKIEEISVPSKKIQVLMKMNTSKLGIALEMDKNDAVGRIKEKIQEMDGIPVNRLVLHANGVELKDHKSLYDSDISEHAEIEVSVKKPSSATSSGASSENTNNNNNNNSLKKLMRVMVLTKCGTKKIPVEVNAGDNVGELRKELEILQNRLHFQLPSEGYFFIYKQNVMDDDRSFRWHHVGQGDTIEIFNGSVTGGS